LWVALPLACMFYVFSLSEYGDRDSGLAQFDSVSDVTHGVAEVRNSFVHELAGVDAMLQSLNTLIDKNPRSWLHLEKLALAYLDRARLTGAFADYQNADNAIQQAFGISGNQVGPYVTRARIHLALHRTDAALNDLNRAKDSLLLDRESELAIEGLIGDAHFQSGNTTLALDNFVSLERHSPSFVNAARLSQTIAAQGNLPLAKRWLKRGEERTVGQSSYHHAWLKLQHGILALQQHQLDDAYRHFTRADRMFPGYWLIEEHLAEVDALSGRRALAEDRYRSIVHRAPIPQMMMALADVLETRDSNGNRGEINSLRTKADQQLAIIKTTYPALASAH